MNSEVLVSFEFVRQKPIPKRPIKFDFSTGAKDAYKLQYKYNPYRPNCIVICCDHMSMLCNGLLIKLLWSTWKQMFIDTISTQKKITIA